MKFLAALAAICMLLVGPAVAQDSWTTRATCSVPFNFVVNGTSLPAGEYRIVTYLGNRLSIQNIEKPDYEVLVQNTNMMLKVGTLQKDTKLVFVRTNGQHVLHQIAVADDNHIHDIIHGADVIELVATR